MACGTFVRSTVLWLTRLYMLIWKNVHLRWRTSSFGCSHRLIGRVPVFLLIELLWPIVLYLIIVILRLQFPSHQHGDDLFHPVALPSAGTLPFIQSVMCDLSKDGGPYTEMPKYPNAPVNEVYSMLDEFGSLNGTLDTFCSTIHSLTQQSTCVNSSTNLAQCQQDVVPLTCFLGDPDRFQTFLTSDLELSPAITQGIIGATVDTRLIQPGGFPFRGKRQIPSLPSGLSDILGNGQTITPTQLRAVLCVGNGVLLNNIVTFDNVSVEQVSDAVCSLNTSQFNALASELQDQLADQQACSPLGSFGLTNVEAIQRAQELFLKFRDYQSDGLFSDFSFDGNTTDGLGLNKSTHFFCGDAEAGGSALSGLLLQTLFGNDYQQSEYENNGGNLTTSVAPDKVSMKILYTPQTPRTQSIIAKASRTFQTIEYLKDWSEQIANCSDEFLTNFPPDSEQANSTRQFISLLLNDNSTDPTRFNITREQAAQWRQTLSLNTSTLESMQELLNASAPGNIWEIVTTIRDVSSGIYSILDRFDWDVFYPTASEDALEALAANYTHQDELNFTTIFAGVVFEGTEDDSLTNASIKIRMNATSVVDPTDITQTVWTPGPENQGWKKAYLFGTFVFIQDMVERALAEEIVGHRIQTPGLYLQQMPYPCYEHDRFVISMEFVLPLAMLFAWLFPVAMTVRAIVREKETRLKEYIKMVGVSDSQLRLSRLIVSGLILLVSVCFITLLLKVGNILPLTDWFILFLYLCLYALVMLGYSFLVSAFFNNANLAACVAFLVYFMVLFGHSIIITKQHELPPVVLGLGCLFAPLGFALGAQYMVQWEVQQVGLNWSNIDLQAVATDPLSFATVSGILLLDVILYFVAAWYIEGVAPGRYGVAKPFYFPFMPSYWFGQSCLDSQHKKSTTHGVEMNTISADTSHQGVESQAEGGAVCEDDPTGLPLGISVENLSKTYQTCRRKKVTAVKDLSLNFFEGQITALLGHNGAGKTTTLSILAGLFEPTSGTAHIYGNSIRKHMDMIRQGLGICPQHNVLFDELTVEEHLLFFGQIKGLSRKQSYEQIPEWLSKVDLLPHAHKLAKHLSGGMKRKLSILLAFVGGSRTIILDEPTAGVDPFARRQIWDFLLRHRDGRTIILSTHHMDEAEILGDRIAIISHGSLICCGSFEFLKYRFGRGHRLTLVTASHSSGGIEGVEEVTDFLEGFVKSVKLEEVRGRELHYLLPLSGARAGVLTQLFRELESAKERLGVVSYGLTACSMEEIFVDLTEKDENAELQDNGSTQHPSVRSEVNEDASVPVRSSGSTSSFADIELEDSTGDGVFEDESEHLVEQVDKMNADRLSKFALWWSQFVALTIKRFHYTKRRFVALSVQNILPLFVLLISLLIAYFLQTVTDPPPIELSPNHLFSVNQDNYMFVGGYYTNETQDSVDSLFQPCGVGAHITSANAAQCFEGNQHSQYDPQSTYDTCSDYPESPQYLCTCNSGCWKSTYYPDYPRCYNGTGTGSRVQNVTIAYNNSNPTLGDERLTMYLLRSKNSFIQARYGGVSFGLEREDIDASLDETAVDDVPFLATRHAAKVWYSLKARHAMPTYINVMNNALLRGNLNSTKQQSQYGFKTISHPFKTSGLSKQYYAITEKNSFLVNPLAMMFSLGFVVAGFVLILIEERSGNVKHLQQVCGMNKAVYWLANSIWDLVWYLCFLVFALILFLAFQDPFYTGTDVLPLLVIILIFYGIAVIPWVYALSFLFKSPATAYVVLFCLNFFGGFCVLIIDAILLFLNIGSDNVNPDNALNYWLGAVPVPAYVLARGMMYLSSDYPLYKVAAAYGATAVPNPYLELGPLLGALVGQTVFYVVILVVIELWPYIRGSFRCLRSSMTALPPPLDTDEDVRRERVKVTSRKDEDNIVTLQGLSKVYGTDLRCKKQRRVAVNQLCLGVKRAECFGLLGVNGAGKTTTFKMLTGDVRPSAGDALIAGHKLSQSRGPVQQSIGYCPQVDALIDQLTGRQHLTLFCRLRGLHGPDVKEMVEWALNKLGLCPYADRAVGAYSGGNRRKLSTAIALLASPPLVLLDEPTSGVDPRARHFLWSIIRGLVSTGDQSVVLTTHSMAECEALCSRVAIMVNGEFHCLGSPQQLKSTYGHGYRLKLRMAGQVEPIKEFVRQNFPNSILKEEHYTTLVYQLPSSHLLHNVFEIMEQARQTLDVQDYSVSQTTLDDVFIHFANEQNEDVGLVSGARRDSLPDIVPLDPITIQVPVAELDQQTITAL